MKRKMSLKFITLIFFSMVIFTIGATYFARNSINDVAKLNLEKYLQIIEIDYQEGLSDVEIINKYKSLNNFLRITIIDPTGVVLADSIASELENHLDRSEIQNLGRVYTRKSETLNINMMYLATQVENNNYLRVAIPTGSVLGFLNDFIGFSIIIGALLVLISIIISSYLIQQSLNPLIKMKSILRDLNQGNYNEVLPDVKYDEVSELIREINEINKSISHNITSLKSEKQKSDFLLNHMNQGICVLDREGRIILLNEYLKSLYRFNIDININKDHRYLFRDDDIQSSIKKAYTDKISINMFVKIKHEYYSVSINYLSKDWNNDSSVILIFSDITAIRTTEILKRDFVVNASHELKSPLTSIIGFSDLIAQGMAKDESTVFDLVSRISSEAKRMNNLVMDMLVLSEYESKNPVTNKLKQNIKYVAEEVIKNMAVQAEHSNIEIHSEIMDVDVFISFEEIYQLLKNIIENAVKYGKSEGNVWVNIGVIDTYLVFEIRDDGIGIPKNDQSRIFERFYRVDKARSKSTGGTGLGLSIVKHIVLNHNGSIELKSEENKGTKVNVYLPLSKLTL